MFLITLVLDNLLLMDLLLLFLTTLSIIYQDHNSTYQENYLFLVRSILFSKNNLYFK